MFEPSNFEFLKIRNKRKLDEIVIANEYKNHLLHLWEVEREPKVMRPMMNVELYIFSL